jgi:hypothetical protein
MKEKGRVGRDGRRGRVGGGDFEAENLGGKLSRARICKFLKEPKNRFPA